VVLHDTRGFPGGFMKVLKENSIRTLAIALMLATVLGTVSAHNSSKQNSNSQTETKIQPLNVKPGLWETTLSYSMAGELPVSPEMLKKMTPEQRARLEEAMRAESGNAHTSTYKNCMKKQDLDNPDFLDKKQCTWTTLESSSTKVKGTASCDYKDEGMKVSGAGEFVAVDQEHVKGNMRMKASGGGREMNTNSVFTSKWLRSDCGNVD
jgi:Protein of unknown function (DUF3617)